MVLMKREYIPYCIILFIIVILTSSCESYSSLDEVNCADCLSFEPLDADLYISVTIDSKYKDVPVVILTGQGDDGLLSEFMENGANRYLTKDDFFIDSLIETIQQVIV